MTLPRLMPATAEASWQGRLERLGFTEELVHLAPPPEAGTAGQDAG